MFNHLIENNEKKTKLIAQFAYNSNAKKSSKEMWKLRLWNLGLYVTKDISVNLVSLVTARLVQQINELGNKQATTLVFKNKEFNLKKELN